MKISLLASAAVTAAVALPGTAAMASADGCSADRQVRTVASVGVSLQDEPGELVGPPAPPAMAVPEEKEDTPADPNIDVDGAF